MITSTIEVEKSLANINVILSLGQGALKSFSSEMFKAASQTGQTFQTASAVALEFARHGVSATETAKRMTSAMQLMRISGLDAQDSVNAITAAINAFNKEGLSSIDIVNRLTAVDTKFAVSAQDLAKAVERVGSTATEAGIKFNQLLGLVTAVQTATARGGAVIGNAFKSIFTRLSRPEVLSDLEAIGVTTRNAQGQILPMVDLLKRLASQYDTLNYAQKSFVTEAVGGVYQVNILKASLADLGRGFSIYDKAAITASQSTGLIEQRMASLNDTIASKLNTTTLQFTRLVSSFGNTAFGAGAKGGLDSFNKQIETIGDGLDDVAENSGFGEKIGHSMAQGVAKGLGDIVSGPGIQIAMALVTKIAKGLGSFAYQSSREFMGLNEPAKQQAAVQQSINGFLQQNVSLVNQWARGQLSLNTLVGVYLQSMKNASIYQGQMANVGGGIAPLVGGSVSAHHATPSSGFIPSFGVPNAQREYMGALAGGYKPGRIFQERIEGLGYVTMNGAETIKRFDGMSQKAILPPRNSKAGSNYQKAFENTHGFDPYASDGYVPNFALYHRDVYVPPVTQQAIQKFVSTPLSLSYGSHAKKAVSDDIHKFGPSGIIPIPKSLKLGSSDIFEVETGQNQSDIQKVVVRRKGDRGLDQILALMPDGNGSAFIKTVWHNQSSDIHKTLDKTKYATAAAGHIPNFGLMNMLGGLGGIGGNLLPKQNLPADISDEEMHKLFAQYATAMYNPKAGKTPIGINLFANKAFHSSYVEKEGNYVFGQHDNNVFLPTHFAPKSKMGGLSIMKDLKKYDNVVMAITKDLSPLLQKAGFAALKENVPVSFRGGEAMKDILVSNKLRTPILGAGMFAALAGGNAKDYFLQHGMRTDKSQRQFHYGEEGRMHNVESYMRNKGLIAAGGVVPKKGYGPMMPDKLQELAYLHKAIKEKIDKKESPGNMMSVFNNKMYEAGFTYGNYADNFVDSLTSGPKMSIDKFTAGSEGNKIFPGFNMVSLNRSGISKDDLRRLLARKGKLKSNQHNYPEFYDIDEFQTMFQEKKKILGVKRALESQVGFGIKPEHDSDIEQLLNKDTSVGNREYYAKNLQRNLISQSIYGDQAGSWNTPPFKSVFKRGKIGQINKAMTDVFDLASEKNKVDGEPISRSLLSERKYLRKQLYIGSYPELANNSVTPERRAELMEDEIFSKAQRRKSIANLLGQNKIMEKLKGLIPGFSHDLPSKSDIVSGNSDYVPGGSLMVSAKYMTPRSDQRKNFASLRKFIDEIREYGADPESGGDDKQLLKNMPTILNTLLPNGPAFDTRQIYRAYSNGLSIHGSRGNLFKKGGEYQSNSAKIWETRNKVIGKVKAMTKQLFQPTVEVPAKWKDNYNSDVTPIMSFNIAKRNLGSNVFRGVNAIEKLYGESIDDSDLVFRGAGAQEFALMDKL
jgi:TP901 family phage tail tape measure protein